MRDSSGRPVELPIEVHTPCGPQELPPCPWQVPDPRNMDDYGCIGEGGDFAPATIVRAVESGIFPWPHPDSERLWFSPNPRAIIPVDGLRVSRRLGRTIRQGAFRATVDAAFERVMHECSLGRPEGTWITPGLLAGYIELNRVGWAHSVEVWDAGGELAGGLYGVGVGAMFGAESMFHRERDASKIAMVALMQHAMHIGLELVDIQVLTGHTASMGGVEVSRDEYLARLAGVRGKACGWWTAATAD